MQMTQEHVLAEEEQMTAARAKQREEGKHAGIWAEKKKKKTKQGKTQDVAENTQTVRHGTIKKRNETKHTRVQNRKRHQDQARHPPRHTRRKDVKDVKDRQQRKGSKTQPNHTLGTKQLQQLAVLQ